MKLLFKNTFPGLQNLWVYSFCLKTVHLLSEEFFFFFIFLIIIIRSLFLALCISLKSNTTLPFNVSVSNYKTQVYAITIYSDKITHNFCMLLEYFKILSLYPSMFWRKCSKSHYLHEYDKRTTTLLINMKCSLRPRWVSVWLSSKRPSLLQRQ